MAKLRLADGIGSLQACEQYYTLDRGEGNVFWVDEGGSVVNHVWLEDSRIFDSCAYVYEYLRYTLPDRMVYADVEPDGRVLRSDLLVFVALIAYLEGDSKYVVDNWNYIAIPDNIGGVGWNLRDSLSTALNDYAIKGLSVLVGYNWVDWVSGSEQVSAVFSSLNVYKNRGTVSGISEFMLNNGYTYDSDAGVGKLADGIFVYLAIDTDYGISMQTNLFNSNQSGQLLTDDEQNILLDRFEYVRPAGWKTSIVSVDSIVLYLGYEGWNEPVVDVYIHRDERTSDPQPISYSVRMFGNAVKDGYDNLLIPVVVSQESVVTVGDIRDDVIVSTYRQLTTEDGETSVSSFSTEGMGTLSVVGWLSGLQAIGSFGTVSEIKFGDVWMVPVYGIILDKIEYI